MIGVNKSPLLIVLFLFISLSLSHADDVGKSGGLHANSSVRDSFCTNHGMCLSDVDMSFISAHFEDIEQILQRLLQEFVSTGKIDLSVLSSFGIRNSSSAGIDVQGVYRNRFGAYIRFDSVRKDAHLNETLWDFPIFGNFTDLENLQKVIDYFSNRNLSEHYFAFTMTDALDYVFRHGVLFILHPFEYKSPLFSILSSTFLQCWIFAILYGLRLYWLGVFALLSTQLISFTYVFRRSGLSTDLVAAYIISMVCASLSMTHLAYGTSRKKRGIHPFSLVLSQLLLAYGASLHFRCQEDYFTDNTLIVFPVLAIVCMLFALAKSSDQDSSRGAVLFYIVSVLAQLYYYFISAVKLYNSPQYLAVYYAALGDIVISKLTVLDKCRAGYSVFISLVSFLVEPDVNRGDGSPVITILLFAGLFFGLYSFSFILSDYFHYSLGIPRHEKLSIHPSVKVVVGACRLILDVYNNFTGFTGITLSTELLRFNGGSSSLSGAIFLALSISYNCLLFSGGYRALLTATIIAFTAYAICIILLNEDIWPLVGKVEKDFIDNTSPAEKLALIATGSQYIPHIDVSLHSFQPFSVLNVTKLNNCLGKIYPYELDGSHGTVSAISPSKFIACLHELLPAHLPQNYPKVTPSNVIGKIVSINGIKAKVTKLWVPYQRSSIGDRLVSFEVDKNIANNFIRSEDVAKYSTGKDCLLYSFGPGSKRDGRTLSTLSFDVMTHNVSAAPADSGGLLCYLDGTVAGIHAGAPDSGNFCVGFRIDTLWKGLNSDDRRVDESNRSTIFEISSMSDFGVPAKSIKDE